MIFEFYVQIHIPRHMHAHTETSLFLFLLLPSFLPSFLLILYLLHLQRYILVGSKILRIVLASIQHTGACSYSC